uniref:Secreted protein n=1 Tax=Mola mola TaxID=94237 RepID=A0A3Q3WLH5_MOLML
MCCLLLLFIRLLFCGLTVSVKRAKLVAFIPTGHPGILDFKRRGKWVAWDTKTAQSAEEHAVRFNCDNKYNSIS